MHPARDECRIPLAATWGASVGTQVEDAGTAARKRAGTLTVVGTMGVIAVVSVTAVVAWARLGRTEAAEAKPGFEEEVPTTLAGGTAPAPVPQKIVEKVDGPVIGAVRLERLSDDMLAACMEFNEVTWDPGNPDLEFAVVTPEGVNASLVGQGDFPGGGGPGRRGPKVIGLRIRCELDLSGGVPSNRGGGGFEEIYEGQPNGVGGFTGSTCCDANGLGTATASVQIPQDARWLLQERGSWYLAYPVEGVDSIGVSWKYRENRFGPGGPPQSRVLLLDADGETIEETFAGGGF